MKTMAMKCFETLSSQTMASKFERNNRKQTSQCCNVKSYKMFRSFASRNVVILYISNVNGILFA